MEQEDRKRNLLVRSWNAVPRRLRVLSLALLIILAGATQLTLILALKFMTLHPDLFVFWYSVAAGPFSSLWVSPGEPEWVLIGTVNLAAILAHPLWPNRVTAVITFLACPFWVFFGLAFAGMSA